MLIGGSPCTHWSIAQKNNRETTAEGIGWELFNNYLIAKEKFKPDYFLYENNKSAAQPIKDQIAQELGVWEGGLTPYTDVRFTYINSALVSAQNRQRFYVTNFGDIAQPEDRGILLRDILESGTDLSQNEKGYCLTASYNGAVPWNTIERGQRTMVAEPVRIGDLPNEAGKISGSQATRIYSVEGKSVNLVANGGGQGAKTGLYACPVEDGNARYLLKKLKYPDEKSGTITACCYKGIGADGMMTVAEPADGTRKPIYEVRNGYITIKDKQYPIKLADGYYIIRKLTVTECCRLQTMPDDYCRAVSNSQGYKGLGNGWTAEVIIHLLKHANIPLDEEIIVLSMYDGIGTGRYCLDKMGYKNVKYYAYEIDKYAMQIANSNYPDIIQCGDAFAVRNEDWRIA